MESLLPYIKEKRSPYSGELVRKYVPTIQPPREGQQTDAIKALTLEYLQELQNGDRDVKNYRIMHKKDPIVRSCIEIKCHRASLSLGTYHHKNPRLEEWVKSNLNSMETDLKKLVGRLSGACATGFTVAEKIYSKSMPGHMGQWRLKGFNVLDSACVTFEGQNGKITHIRYESGTGQIVRIPYWKCIHVTNSFGLSETDEDEVFGLPESRAAYPYYKAKIALMTNLISSTKTKANGIIVGKVDSNVSVEQVDLNGNPIKNPDGSLRTESAGSALMRQLVFLEKNGYIVTDKNNDLTSLSLPTDDASYTNAIAICDKALQRAYSVPDLIFQDSTASLQSGQMASMHEGVLDSTIEPIVNQIRKQLLDTIKILIIFNFGVQDDYGSFERTTSLDPTQSGQKLSNIATAVGSGLVSANDINIINSVYELLGLSSITVEEQSNNLRSDLINAHYRGLAGFGTPIPGVTGPSNPPPEQTEGGEDLGAPELEEKTQ